MPKPTRPPRDRLFTLLDRIEKRLRGLERPSRLFASLVPWNGIAATGTSAGGFTDVFTMAGAAVYSRVAYRFVASVTAGTVELRVVAYRGSGTYTSGSPLVLDTDSTGSTAGVVFTGNVELPDDVQDGDGWTFAIQAKTVGGGTYSSSFRAVFLTNDPDLIPTG